MYQALYRKWRPRTFTDVCGQETVTTALKNELKNDRLSHAYLFTGCRGTGKTTCAKILAKAVNCEHPVDGDPCNECPTCRGIDDGSVLDVTEIDAASNNGVDSIRDLREEVSFTPVTGKYRVYIIDEVHMLSAGAFNALLKTLEEPPAHVIFVLATTEVHKLPATILSRCQRFDFGRIRPEVIAERVRYVAEQEGLTVTPDAALLLARLADGAMRDALSLLDQCASGHREIDAAVVVEATGMASVGTAAKLTDCVIRKDGAAALAAIDEAYTGSMDMERLCGEWIRYMRNLMVLHSVREVGELIIASPDELEQMRTQAGQLDLPAILHIMEILQTALERLHGGASRRIEMEMAALRACDPRLDDGMAALLHRVSDLEAALRDPARAPIVPAASVAPAPVQAPPAIPEPEIPAPVQADAPDPAPIPAPIAPAVSGEEDEVPFTAWADVLERLQTTCMPLYGVLADSGAVLKGDLLLICTDNALFKELFLRDNNKDLLADAVRSASGRTYRFGIRRTQRVPRNAPVDPLAQLMDASRNAGVTVNEKE